MKKNYKVLLIIISVLSLFGLITGYKYLHYNTDKHTDTNNPNLYIYGDWDNDISILKNEDITIYGVTGTLETSGAKVFSTQEEMQADPTAKEGDLAVVYNSNKNVETNNLVNTVIFPKIVTLDTVIAEEITGAILSLPDRPWDFTVTLTPTSYSIHREPTGSSALTIIQYTSEDGITYNRVTSLENDLYTFDLVDGWQTEWENIVLNKFMFHYPPTFGGFYEYNGTEYVEIMSIANITKEEQ